MTPVLTAARPLPLALLCLLAWPLASPAASPGEPAAAALVSIEGSEIDEASGLARSTWLPGMFWTHNDSGGQPELHAVSSTGRHVATVRLAGSDVYNVDWEDIASFRRHGVGYLLVADIGDNYALRDTVTCYLLREPHFPVHPGTQRLEAVVERTFVLRYPDGARDAESVAVDGDAGQVFVLSKRTAVPQLYRFALDMETSAARPGVMTALGPIHLPAQVPDLSGIRDVSTWATAMDFSDALDAAYVGTLTTGYLYRRQGREPWEQAFARLPEHFMLPSLPQTEGGSFAAGSSDRLWVISEGVPARMGQTGP